MNSLSLCAHLASPDTFNGLSACRSCEFLEKLDLTVNFVDLDFFKESIEHLAPLAHFKELFLMGNPCMEWPHAKDFIIATLPQLQRLDGQDITRTERITAGQNMAVMLADLASKASQAAAAKVAKELEELVGAKCIVRMHARPPHPHTSFADTRSR